ncbi:MAG TPA: hypothetical protein VNN12_04885 [Dehalococcoidia bacterium]|nr:hypothetical protein [Dehalococcoidia bacterium]
MRGQATVIRFRRRSPWRRLYDRWGVAPLYVAALAVLVLLHALLRLL